MLDESALRGTDFEARSCSAKNWSVKTEPGMDFIVMGLEFEVSFPWADMCWTQDDSRRWKT